MPRRRKLPPDTRPNWRDPQMPCTRNYLMSDGTTKTAVDPEYERRFREVCMEINAHPTWRSDPTYDLKKQRKRL